MKTKKEFEKIITLFTDKIKAEEKLAADLFKREIEASRFNIDKEIKAIKKNGEIKNFDEEQRKKYVERLQEQSEDDFFWDKHHQVLIKPVYSNNKVAIQSETSSFNHQSAVVNQILAQDSLSISAPPEEHKLGVNHKKNEQDAYLEFLKGFFEFHHSEYKKAYRYFLNAYEAGYKPAIYYLASMHRQGLEVEKLGDDQNKYLQASKSVDIFLYVRKEAEQSLQGKYNLAFYYQNIETTDDNIKNALTLYEEVGSNAAEDFVVPAALYTLSRSKASTETQLKYRELAANKGFAKAQYEMGIKNTNEMKQIDWWTKAANQGLYKAQLSLAFLYSKKPLPSLAVKWYAKSAAQTQSADVANSLLRCLSTFGEGYMNSVEFYLNCKEKNNIEIFFYVITNLNNITATKWLEKCVVHLSKEKSESITGFDFFDRQIITKYIEIIGARISNKKESPRAILLDLFQFFKECQNTNFYLFMDIIKSICDKNLELLELFHSFLKHHPEEQIYFSGWQYVLGFRKDKDIRAAKDCWEKNSEHLPSQTALRIFSDKIPSFSSQVVTMQFAPKKESSAISRATSVSFSASSVS